MGKRKVPNLLVSGLDFFIHLKPWQVSVTRACSGGLSCCSVLEVSFHGWDYTGHIEFWGGRKLNLSQTYQASGKEYNFTYNPYPAHIKA
ncbi:hypothetical protein [Candidatus Villigracilis saccharophilus]|uniref:hypothetical protein n=1 Tax=Candidatus Villigracilis saccharophilus TaxID=3140684 RepID=UPI0031376CFE|nr:hypothetical protein [Anaerolineales bacterium]